MVLEKIRAIMAEKLDCDPAELTPETKFEDLGIDSLDVTEIVMNLEDEFSLELEVDQSLKTVADLEALITSKLEK